MIELNPIERAQLRALHREGNATKSECVLVLAAKGLFDADLSVDFKDDPQPELIRTPSVRVPKARHGKIKMPYKDEN